MNIFFVASKRRMTTMAITVVITFAFASFRFLNAFSSYVLVSPRSRGCCDAPMTVSSFLHFASHSDKIQFSEDNDDDDEGTDAFYCDMEIDTWVLNWNLDSLLSSDPSMDARYIPLMAVYDAAAKAAQEKASMGGTADSTKGQQETCQQDCNIGTTPTNAPSRLPGNTEDLSSALLQSMQHNGSLPPGVAPYRMFVREYNFDMGHDGRFTVFPEESLDTSKNSAHPSLQSDVVFSTNDPLAFIRDNLSFRGGVSNWNSNDKEEAIVFLPGPHTLHDPQAKKNHEQERSSSDRLKYISQVLDGLPIAQLHTGTHIDQGSYDIELTSDTVQSLLSFGLLTDDFQRRLSLLSMEGNSSSPPKKAYYRLRARDLDIIHSVLTRGGSIGSPSLSRDLGDEYLGSDSKGLKDALIRLIDIAVRSVREEQSQSSLEHSSSPHLVLMAYSATSNVLMSALSEWKRRVTTPIDASSINTLSDNESTKVASRDGVGVGVDESSNGDTLERTFFSVEEAELLLHKALTVVTISALSRGFVDGPAYIHVSMNDDPLAASLGITKANPEGGGKDAVILQALSPYLIDTESHSSSKNSFASPYRRGDRIYKNDAHNIDSCVIQYLSLVRRINGVTSFREMYNVGNDDSDNKKLDISTSLFAIDYRSVGQLIMPPCIDTDLIPAMIRATGGERWLWDPDFQLGEGGIDGFDSPLPSLEYAQAELQNQLGYNAYDEIVENCCHQ